MFRSFKVTIEYTRTKDIVYVKELLRHKQRYYMLIYTHLVSFQENSFDLRVANNVEEAQSLIEDGFEFVMSFEGKAVFKKRKQ